ncbi:hypothetical protein C8Q75DRAFT_492026 [Abortiporus biennis]|nr:hypothetical protein C8Q75DRAFT_492026 [Abortiporus biennis]
MSRLGEVLQDVITLNQHGHDLNHRDLYTLDQKYLDDVWLLRATTFASYTVLVYEFIETFPDEVKFIWSTRWSTVKAIFVLNRYSALICMGLVNAQVAGYWSRPSQSFCFNVTMFQSIFIFLSLASLHVIMLMRAWVIWGRRKFILAILMAFFIFSCSASLAVVLWGMVITGYDSYPLSSIVGTCVGYIPPILWVLWLPSILDETAVFVITMMTIRQHNLTNVSSGRASIIRTLYRDAVAYFIIILFSNFFNIFVWVFDSNSPRNMMANTITVCLVNVAGQRLVLDLRQIDRSCHTLSTSRLGREVDRVFQGIIPISPRSRSPSPIIFEMRNPRKSGRRSKDTDRRSYSGDRERERERIIATIEVASSRRRTRSYSLGKSTFHDETPDIRHISRIDEVEEPDTRSSLSRVGGLEGPQFELLELPRDDGDEGLEAVLLHTLSFATSESTRVDHGSSISHVQRSRSGSAATAVS